MRRVCSVPLDHGAACRRDPHTRPPRDAGTTHGRTDCQGVYRDAVRSSHNHVVKATGLRWVCLMLLILIAWAGRVWALPFLTALAPSERYDAHQGRHHKALTDWVGQLLLVVRRWWPDSASITVMRSAVR